MSNGTTVVNAFSGVASRSAAPATLPMVATSASDTNDRSQRGMRSRSESPAMRLPGVSATVLETLAITAGKPAASSAGKVISDAPPTIAVTTPPARPAPKSRSPRWPSTCARRLRDFPQSPGRRERDNTERGDHDAADLGDTSTIVEIDRVRAPPRIELHL